MCTVVVLIRPQHPWPVTLAANRDERIERAWDPPGRWWPAYPGVVGGRDRLAGGTWMALGRSGVAAAVLNRPGTLGPLTGKRSRGDLPLLAAAQPSAEAAADVIAALDASHWRGFNLVVADAAGAWFIRGTGEARPHALRLPPGLHMVTAQDPNDLASPRIARHLPRFRTATPPRGGSVAAPLGDRLGAPLGDRLGAPLGAIRGASPGSPVGEPLAGEDWGDWPKLLGDRGGDTTQQLDIDPRGGFGTVCASLLALPRAAPPVWLFAAGRPHAAAFLPVTGGEPAAATA